MPFYGAYVYVFFLCYNLFRSTQKAWPDYGLYRIFITHALCLRYIIQLYNSLSQFNCPSWHCFSHCLVCLLNNSFWLWKMEWLRTEKQGEERELDYFLWTTETDRIAVLYCTRNKVTNHENWSAFIEGQESPKTTTDMSPHLLPWRPTFSIWTESICGLPEGLLTRPWTQVVQTGGEKVLDDSKRIVYFYIML